MLKVLVLGSVRVPADSGDYALGGDKQRALLARLVMARGRTVSPERLIAELWDDAPPRVPGHALQARISRLRSATPLDIELVNGGYRLDPAVVRTDAADFEQLCKEARWSLEDGAIEQAGKLLHQGLGLWRGPALSGLHAIPAISSEATRLQKLRDSAIADRIDTDLALGLCATIVPELYALVVEQPFSERHWGQLMSALYCDGRAHEALEVFTRVRELFADRLGVEPSGELGQLHVQILQGEPPDALLRSPLAPPVSGGLVEREGDRHDVAGLAATSNRLDTFVGLLRRHGALILTGPAGIGKSHLIRSMATRFEAQRRLAPLLRGSILTQTVPLGVFTGAAGASGAGQRSPSEWMDFFARHRSNAVVLVDDVDKLDDASLLVVTQLIRTADLPAVLTARDLTTAPQEIRALYDAGQLTEIEVDPLTTVDAHEVLTRIVGGQLAPDAYPPILATAQGNPLYLREVVTASRADGRLVDTEHGWELRGNPVTTARLTQLLGERFSGLDDTSLEAVAKVALAKEYPLEALSEVERRALARTDVVELADAGWLRLARPIDEAIIRERCSMLLWSELTRDVVKVLRGDAAAGRPGAQRRAHELALDLDEPLDASATLVLAEHALGRLDVRLALRAAEAVLAVQPGCVQGHRTAGAAASALGMLERADAHLGAARRASSTVADVTAVALIRAQHAGLQHHDAAAAVVIIDEALETAQQDHDQAVQLRRDRLRWAAVAGRGQGGSAAPVETPDAAAVQGMITFGVSAVITGPLNDAHTALARLRRVPAEMTRRVAGGTSLIQLTEIMALSYTGDAVATRRRLQQEIRQASSHAPETLGMWQYALGFSELLSGSAEKAHALAQEAVARLGWRDTVGLFPAAHALGAAAAQATGRSAEAEKFSSAIPEAADSDPKVVMLRAWSSAWGANVDRGDDDAGSTLVETARWMLRAEHTFFAGILAHCAVRVGTCVADAHAVLTTARLLGGGGLLDLLAGHAEATVAGDLSALDTIAQEASELGLTTTAADTWLTLAEAAEDHNASASAFAARQLDSVNRLRGEVGRMALWTAPLDAVVSGVDGHRGHRNICGGLRSVAH